MCDGEAQLYCVQDGDVVVHNNLAKSEGTY